VNIFKKISVLCAFSVMLGTSGITAQKNDPYHTTKKITSLIASVATGALMGKVAFAFDKAIGKTPNINTDPNLAFSVGCVILTSWFVCFLIRKSTIGCISDVIWEEEKVAKRPAMYSAARLADWITYVALSVL
jgi:hypothetical protein